ncbi:MAG: nucleoside recognition domain-containing protein [Bacillota bacterium]
MGWIWETAWRAVEIWARALPYTILGILLANLALELGLFHRLFPLIRPFLRRAGFSGECGVAFLVAFGSPPTAAAMLAGFFQEGKIGPRETLLAAVGTWFPQTVYESIVHLAPAAIPFLGVVGLAYIGFFLANGFLVSGLVFIAAAFLLSKNSAESSSSAEREKPSWREVMRRCLEQTFFVLKRMILIALPVSVAVLVFVNSGILKNLPGSFIGFALPPEALTAIPVCLANPVAAYAMLADLLQRDILDFRLTLLTLLMANFVTSLRYILTHRLPYHMGIFGAGMGLRVTAVGALLRLGWTVFFIAILFSF